MKQKFGAIYTPEDLAEFLVSWAVQEATDSVLDLGVGEGVFVFKIYEKLLNLQASKIEAAKQIYGTEIDPKAYSRFLKLANLKNITFPNIRHADFFESEFPEVDVIVGNPPYVRRRHIENLDRIRASVLTRNEFIKQGDLSKLTDLYVYFLLKSLTYLKSSGRVATIIADSWLNVRYGEILKAYLKEHFHIEQLVSIDHRVFLDAQVKPILLLAVKKKGAVPKKQVTFIRIRNGSSTNILKELPESLITEKDDIHLVKIPVSKLSIKDPWGMHFKISELYSSLAKHELMTPISKFATTRIGLQTLAEKFFTFTQEQAAASGIEERFLEPYIRSSADCKTAVVDETTQANRFLFYCSESKQELKGTKALLHILSGETAEVEVKGKNKTVRGYHEKERIKEANRPYWYDVKTEVDRRDRTSILIPRLVFREFFVIWNKAKFIPGGAIIEFVPFRSYEDIDSIQLFLAILNCSLTEIMLRVNSQVYGGGTYNLGVSQVKNVPILNIDKLSTLQKKQLTNAYYQFLTDYDRSEIDQAIFNMLGISEEVQEDLLLTLQDLRAIATTAKKRAK